MTRDQAASAIQEYLRGRGLESPGLNPQDLGGAQLGAEQLYFEHEGETLKCLALVHRFHAKARPQVLAAFREEKELGGGALEYRAPQRCLFLVRAYETLPSAARFSEELDRLLAACERLRHEGAERVAARANTSAELG